MMLAIPVLRLGGVFFALATFAFALMFQSVLVPQDWVGGGELPIKVARPNVLGIDFAADKSFLFLAIGVLALAGTLVILIRKGTLGRNLDAMRGSETAAHSIGINTARAKIVAFGIAGAIAGLGGAMLSMHVGRANVANFEPLAGLFFIVLVVVLGSRTVEGAIQAGLAFSVFPALLREIGIKPAYQYVLFGLAAMQFARHPEGLVEAGKWRALRLMNRRKADPDTLPAHG
jgi:ABC-type branched-subunit amino acid transport system permease subunit